MKFPFGNRLLRAAMSLGFLVAFIGCLVARDASRVTAHNGHLIFTSEALLTACEVIPNSTVAEPVEIGRPDGFGAVLEDSDEMLRVDIEQRSFDFDWRLIGAKVAAKTAFHPRPNISPPLLV